MKISNLVRELLSTADRIEETVAVGKTFEGISMRVLNELSYLGYIDEIEVSDDPKLIAKSLRKIAWSIQADTEELEADRD